MVKDDKYFVLKKKGSVAEQFFLERHNELLRQRIVPLVDMTEWHKEGSDIGAERMILTPLQRANKRADWMHDLTDGQQFGFLMQYGGAEVKYVGSAQFLPRFGINNRHDGTLGFALWQGTEDLPNGGTDYQRTAHGNMRRWMEPSVANNGARPMILICLLGAADINRRTGEARERFFASIAFEDVDGLLNRLIGYAAEHNLDLTDWDNQIPVGAAAQNFTVPGLFFQGNMWHVPVSVIGDLATVTMIGADPQIYPTGRCAAEIQYARLNYLKKLAAGRWTQQEKLTENVTESDPYVLDLWHRRLFMGQPRYPEQRDANGRRMRS